MVMTIGMGLPSHVPGLNRQRRTFSRVFAFATFDAECKTLISCAFPLASTTNQILSKAMRSGSSLAR